MTERDRKDQTDTGNDELHQLGDSAREVERALRRAAIMDAHTAAAEVVLTAAELAELRRLIRSAGNESPLHQTMDQKLAVAWEHATAEGDGHHAP